MRCENYAAAVSAPVFGIQRSIVFGNKRIAAITKNGFDEIKVADQIAWSKEAYFHGFF